MKARQNHERPGYYYAVDMPLAVIESGVTHLCEARHTVVISPHEVRGSAFQHYAAHAEAVG